MCRLFLYRGSQVAGLFMNFAGNYRLWIKLVYTRVCVYYMKHDHSTRLTRRRPEDHGPICVLSSITDTDQRIKHIKLQLHMSRMSVSAAEGGPR